MVTKITRVLRKIHQNRHIGALNPQMFERTFSVSIFTEASCNGLGYVWDEVAVVTNYTVVDSETHI